MTNNPATSAQHPRLRFARIARRMKTWSEPPVKIGARHKQPRPSYKLGTSGYYPSGGGIWGAVDDTSSIYNLGDPTHEAILKLARPIMVPVRQNFAVEAQFFTVGSTDALVNLNTGATDDEKVIMFGRKAQDRLAA